MKKLISLAIVASVAFMGCSVVSAGVSGPVVDSSGKRVSSETSNMNILGLTAMKLEKAEEATKSLAGQCGGGEVVNVTNLMKHTSYGILQFETLSVSGHCK